MDVRELSWEDAAGWLEAPAIHGGYIIMTESRELWYHAEKFYHADYFVSQREMLARGDVDGLKGVANDHHRSVVLKALTSPATP